MHVLYPYNTGLYRLIRFTQVKVYDSTVVNSQIQSVPSHQQQTTEASSKTANQLGKIVLTNDKSLSPQSTQLRPSPQFSPLPQSLQLSPSYGHVESPQTPNRSSPSPKPINLKNQSSLSLHSVSQSKSTPPLSPSNSHRNVIEMNSNREMNLPLVQLASKLTVLVLACLISTTITTIIGMTTSFGGAYLVAIDANINSVCLMLSFGFNEFWYKLLCKPCHFCFGRWVVKICDNM